jgi:hypothetical protein
MDLLDLANGSDIQKNLATKVVEILKTNCATNRFYKKDDIQTEKIKDGFSVYVVGYKVFQIKQLKTLGDKLSCKGEIIDRFDLLKYIDNEKYTDEDMQCYRIIRLEEFLAALPALSVPIFMYCLEMVRIGDFGCCNSFIECSDAKMCITDDRELYLGCAYRKNLESGKIFYGKNKNINSGDKKTGDKKDG